MAKGTLALRQIKLGDNAYTSKNFVISVPAVADGTISLTKENGALLDNFVNDAAAQAGGVPVGGLYRNGSVVMVRVA